MAISIFREPRMGFGQSRSLGLWLCWMTLGTAAPLRNAAAADTPKDILSVTKSAIAATNLTPYDLGSRYAQALGASETCPGGKMTDKAAVLRALYTGADLNIFNAQEKKIYDAWMRAKHCVQDENSNECNVVIEESCAAAISEIGPHGSAIPGLFEIARP
jgi:hypothetical protein